MKCIRCGAQIERRGMNQKYCASCAQQSRMEHAALWRANHAIVTQRRCKRCGVPVGKNRHFCDKCLADKRREYHRQYKRRVRAKK